MNISAIEIKKEIDGLISYLIEKGICDDQNFSCIDTSENNIEQITFSGKSEISIALKNLEYRYIYQEILKNRAFNMRLIDGALLQLMYIIANKNIKKHRLAFYPSPVICSFQENPEGYMGDELYIDIVKRKIIPFPLRFDFDLENHRDVKHPQSHLTLGDIKNCRIPISHPITPRWFIEFILRNFYNTEKHDFISNLPKHKISFPPSITDNEAKIIHIKIPYVTDN